LGNILLRSVGTDGDVLPFLCIGRRLKASGHNVTLLSHCSYQTVAAKAGLDFAALDTPEEYARFIQDEPLLNTPPGIPQFIRKHSLPNVAREYELIRQRCRQNNDVLVTRDLFDTTARIAGETLGIPVLWVFIAPSQLMTREMRAELFAGVLAADVNQLRRELGLSPVRVWRSWLEYRKPSIALWPDWFAGPDTTWPEGVVPVGFVLDNEAETDEIPAEVQAILNGREAPILVTPGTGTFLGAEFASVSAAACERLNRPGILVIQHDRQVPERLPPSVKRFGRLPFGKLMPHVAAVIHHGGRGTLSCAIAAGTPQLLLTQGADRPDNAVRLHRLGVAEYLPTHAWRSDRVAEKLSDLINSATVRDRCRDLADRTRRMDPLATASTLIEDYIRTNKASDAVGPRSRQIDRQGSISPPHSMPASQFSDGAHAKGTKKSKILLTSKLPYIPALSGASKADRQLLEGLAGRGHSCRAIVLKSAASNPEGDARFLAELSLREISLSSSSLGIDIFHHNGVEVHAVGDTQHLCAELGNQIRQFEPDWILVSEDRSYLCLAAALDAGPSCVVYLCHSPATLPFGPECFLADTTKTALLRRAAGIITVSRYLKDYIRQWGGLEASVIPFPVYGEGPFMRYGRFDHGFVTIVNPSLIKGISIFLELARARPDIQFAAVPSWATRNIDRSALERLPNVRLLAPTEHIDEIFAQTRVLLLPSLWGEAFGYLVVEAMLRGIPVLASRIGGLPEAKLGTDYLLPVRPIERYEERLDDCLLPLPVVPEQDLEPWLGALAELLSNRATYERVSSASRDAALSYVAGLDVGPFEKYLEDLSPTHTPPALAQSQTERQGQSAPETEEVTNGLSLERLELLALLLRSSGKTGRSL
jgi:UDP:flavonoid glycosyltransferase YjiC (YdhE family)/glycosyltransferase involved in cell wall biosynthesis